MRNPNSALSVFILAALVAVGSSACSDSLKKRPVVDRVQTIEDGLKPRTDGSVGPSIQVQMTLNKDALFHREFLYGADLQSSTYTDEEYAVTLQVIAIGHIPARFRVAGEELQLVSDNKRSSPSDINHPEQLLTRFRIVTQDAKTITVSSGKSDVLLASAFQNQINYVSGKLTNPKSQPVKDSWIRSTEFDAKGDYLLQESSIVLVDGTIAEFMESIFPRENLAPSSAFEAIVMDPDHPIGADEGPAARFRLLGGEKIYDSEQALTYAAHFDIGNGATIDWYVTPNAPDDQMDAIRAGVEGWNRYFRSFAGIDRDVVRFAGRLPGGVKVGDPRYNVISWDSRLVAGAAYESQAADPHTGKQSHSLIYLPAAWTQIGKDYWTNGVYSDPAVNPRRKLPSRLGDHTACFRDLRPIAALAASGALGTQDEIADFSKRLLAQTLLHEVGHALGLAHNFKGSLTLDRNQANSTFSSSIMDYNEFAIERAAFSDLASSSGPLLEYDRQALSALYNRQADILPEHPVMPACNDAEADNEEGGIDPLCARYDLEKDPSGSITTAWKRLSEATLPGLVTSSEAVGKVTKLTLNSEAVAAATGEAEFAALVAKLHATLRGSVRFYLAVGPTGYLRSITTHLRILQMHAEGSLPDDYSAAAMRERVFSGLRNLLELKQLPDAVLAALEASRTSALQTLAESPYIRQLPADAAQVVLTEASETLAKVPQFFVSDETRGLPAIRAAVLSELVHHEAAPFFLGEASDGTSNRQVDFELALIGVLAETVRDATKSDGERLAAAASLVSFKDRYHADQAIQGALAVVEIERSNARTQRQRELAERLRKILG